jgi:hypothetical protein
MAERARIWWAAAVPPVLWMAQGAIGWFIAAHACPSSSEPMSLGTARLAIGAITLAALGISIVGLVRARQTRRSLSDDEGHPAVVSAAAERRRFVATVGLVVCITLTLGLLLAGLPALFVHGCGEIR